MSPEERIQAVADAMERSGRVEKLEILPGTYSWTKMSAAALAAADATRPKLVVTHEAAKAAYNVHNSASEFCKYQTDLERCWAAIEAALKVMES